MKAKRAAAVVVLLIGAAMLGGCWGNWSARGDKTNTTQFRIHGELVPNAQLAREDTKPIETGRLAFIPGTEQLLVITRITSVAKDRKNPQAGREDRYFERVWITIPLDAPLDAELDLAELEQSFALSYDRKEPGLDYFIYPSRVTGKVTMLERRESEAVVKIDAMVAPRHVNRWRLQETLTVPVTPTGIYASRAEVVQRHRYNPMMRPIPDMTIFEQGVVDAGHDEDVQHGSSPAGSVTMSHTGPDGADVQAAAGDDAAEETPAAEQSIIGHWFTKIANWDQHYQFNPDGTFIFAATRGNEPMVLEGTWLLRDAYVVLTYKKFYSLHEGGYRGDHMKFISNPTTMAKVTWRNEDLVLDGALAHTHAAGPYTFRRDGFADMRYTRPPRNVRP